MQLTENQRRQAALALLASIYTSRDMAFKDVCNFNLDANMVATHISCMRADLDALEALHKLEIEAKANPAPEAAPAAAPTPGMLSQVS